MNKEEKLFEISDLFEKGIQLNCFSEDIMLEIMKMFPEYVNSSTLLIKVFVYYEKIHLIESMRDCFKSR